MLPRTLCCQELYMKGHKVIEPRAYRFARYGKPHRGKIQTRSPKLMRPVRLEARPPAAILDCQKPPPHTYRPHPHPRAFLQDFRDIEISVGMCLKFQKFAPNFVYNECKMVPNSEVIFCDPRPPTTPWPLRKCAGLPTTRRFHTWSET